MGQEKVGDYASDKEKPPRRDHRRFGAVQEGLLQQYLLAFAVVADQSLVWGVAPVSNVYLFPGWI